MSPAVVKVNYVAMSAGGRAAAGASADYYAHRPDAEGEREYRAGFDAENEEMSKNEVYSRIEEGEGEYAYRIVLSPGEEMDAGEIREWARDVMEPIEEEGGQWVGFVHDDHTEHPHAHVIAFTDEKLDREDLAGMREIGTEGAELAAEQKEELEEDREAGWIEKAGMGARTLAEEAGAEAKRLGSDMSTHGVIGVAEGMGEEIRDLASDAEDAGTRIVGLLPGGEEEPDPVRDRVEEDARELEIQDWMDASKAESDELMGIRDPMQDDTAEDESEHQRSGAYRPETDRRELMELEHEDPSPEAQHEP